MNKEQNHESVASSASAPKSFILPLLRAQATFDLPFDAEPEAKYGTLSESMVLYEALYAYRADLLTNLEDLALKESDHPDVIHSFAKVTFLNETIDMLVHGIHTYLTSVHKQAADIL